MAASGAVLLRSSLQVIYWKLDPPRGSRKRKGVSLASREGVEMAGYDVTRVGGSRESNNSYSETDKSLRYAKDKKSEVGFIDAMQGGANLNKK